MKERVRKRRETRQASEFERSWKRKLGLCNILEREKARSQYPSRHIPCMDYSVTVIPDGVTVEQALEHAFGSDWVVDRVCVFKTEAS